MDFNQVCQSGDIELAKKMYSENPNIKIVKYEVDSIPIEEFESRKKYRPHGCPISRFSTPLFLAIHKKHYELAEWLCEICPEIDIEQMHDNALRMACMNNDIELVKWVTTRFPTLDITYACDWYFRIACVNGYLELAQYLSQLKEGRYEIIQPETIDQVYRLHYKIYSNHNGKRVLLPYSYY